MDSDRGRGLNPKDMQVGDPPEGSKFETHFEEPYKVIKYILTDHVADGSFLIDIGANVGNLEDYLDQTKVGIRALCIDNDPEALGQLSSKKFNTLQAEPILSDANDFIDRYDGLPADVLLMNTTLHEICNPDQQAEYLRHLFSRVNSMVKPDGKAIFGDYFYSPDVSDDDVAAYMEQQMREINHADARGKFVDPKLLMKVAKECGYDARRFSSIAAATGIDRLYYAYVFQRMSQED